METYLYEVLASNKETLLIISGLFQKVALSTKIVHCFLLQTERKIVKTKEATEKYAAACKEFALAQDKLHQIKIRMLPSHHCDQKRMLTGIFM